MTSNLDVPCRTCRTPAGQPCHTTSLRPRDPHAARMRTTRLAAEHPVQWRGDHPVSVPLKLSDRYDAAGHRTITVLCPLCWSEHHHGWDDSEDTSWSHRAAHCAPRIAGTRGYWIPPTADLRR